MRILVDGATLIGPRTGIGWYTHRLLLALAQQEGVEQIGIAIGSRVMALDQLSDDLTSSAKTASIGQRIIGGVRRAIGELVPYARDLGIRTREVTLAKSSRAWTLFHQPNYIAPRLPVPLVTTVCDMGYAACPQWLPRERQRWLARWLGVSLERSRAIVTISEFTRGELLAEFPKLDASRVFATPLGVDHRRFQPTTTTADETLHARLGLPAKFTLFLGTLEPRKNLQGLLQAYARLPVALQRAYPLVLAGVAGWKQHVFARELRELHAAGVVKVLGYVAQDDIPALLRAAELLVFPSFYEGFGLPVLEAAACGTPVLCSRAASLPEVMGDAAHYVDPTQPDDIAAGIVRLLEDSALRQTLRGAGLSRAKNYCWERCAEATMRAYRAAA